MTKRTMAVAMTTLLLLVSALGPMSIGAEAAGPDDDTFFKYRYKQKVDRGSGEYSGYTEKTKSKGEYRVEEWGPSTVYMTAHYEWTYKNNEGTRREGETDRSFSFSLSTRRYTSPMIDLDDAEYSGYAPGELCVWFWIPTDLQEGDDICILDDDGTVTDKTKVLWSRGIPRRVIEVVVGGTWSRDDDYGRFDYTYEDKLYFDRDTGMFVGERYEEHDEGTYQGLWASFRYTVKTDVTRSSYYKDIAFVHLLGVYGLFLLTVYGIALGCYKARWSERRHRFKRLGDVRIRRIFKMEDYPRIMNEATDHFEPFLEHWVEKALRAKDRVAVAVRESTGALGTSTLLAVAMNNKEASIGTILCKSTELTETIRRYIGCTDFFTEVRHMIEPDDEMRKDSWVMTQLSKVNNEAYNIFETHKVYKLEDIRPNTFDTKLVRPMREGDLPQVTALAKKVFKADSEGWVTSAFETGDLAYVATSGNAIVGFGFGCVSGTHGRLHTLAVDKAFRNKGIGKELHRARLEVMRLMGVTDVIDEIADWNLASIRISTLSGFQPVGKMYVETARTQRIKKNIVRR